MWTEPRICRGSHAETEESTPHGERTACLQSERRTLGDLKNNRWSLWLMTVSKTEIGTRWGRRGKWARGQVRWGDSQSKVLSSKSNVWASLGAVSINLLFSCEWIIFPYLFECIIIFLFLITRYLVVTLKIRFSPLPELVAVVGSCEGIFSELLL